MSFPQSYVTSHIGKQTQYRFTGKQTLTHICALNHCSGHLAVPCSLFILWSLYRWNKKNIKKSFGVFFLNEEKIWTWSFQKSHGYLPFNTDKKANFVLFYYDYYYYFRSQPWNCQGIVWTQLWSQCSVCPPPASAFNHRQYGLCLESNDCHHLALMFSVTGT